jgi:AcrR family transcriptional regulator
MCPRQYRLGKREAEIQATRDAILRAAKDLFQESGYHRTSVEDVARRADVAPATVYYQFGSKPGLLDAALASTLNGYDVDEWTSGSDAFDDLDQVVASAVRRVCHLWMQEPDLLRSLLGLGAVDPTLRPVIEAHNEARQTMLRQVATQLAAREALAQGYDECRAADVLSMLTSFASFDHLVGHRGFSPDAAIESLTGLALMLIDPARRHGPASGQLGYRPVMVQP